MLVRLVPAELVPGEDRGFSCIGMEKMMPDGECIRILSYDEKNDSYHALSINSAESIGYPEIDWKTIPRKIMRKDYAGLARALMALMSPAERRTLWREFAKLDGRG